MITDSWGWGWRNLQPKLRLPRMACLGQCLRSAWSSSHPPNTPQRPGSGSGPRCGGTSWWWASASCSCWPCRHGVSFLLPWPRSCCRLGCLLHPAGECSRWHRQSSRCPGLAWRWLARNCSFCAWRIRAQRVCWTGHPRGRRAERSLFGAGCARGEWDKNCQPTGSTRETGSFNFILR